MNAVLLWRSGGEAGDIREGSLGWSHSLRWEEKRVFTWEWNPTQVARLKLRSAGELYSFSLIKLQIKAIQIIGWRDAPGASGAIKYSRQGGASNTTRWTPLWRPSGCRPVSLANNEHKQVIWQEQFSSVDVSTCYVCKAHFWPHTAKMFILWTSDGSQCLKTRPT